MVWRFLDTSCVAADKRAGTLLTAATWMRQFVDKHPEYNHDSVISKEVNYDLIKAVDAM